MRIDRIGGSATITATVGEQSTRRPDYTVDGENRWLDDVSVLDVGQLEEGRLEAASPGTAALEVFAFGKGPETLTVIVEPEDPVVVDIRAEEPVAQGDEVELRGYRMDALDENALTIEGVAANFTRADSATFAAAAPDVSASDDSCEGSDMLSLSVAGAPVRHTRPAVRGVRPEAHDLQVGEAVALGEDEVACLEVAGEAGGSRYALAYLDPSNIEEARQRKQTNSDINDLFGVGAEDWTLGAPSGGSAGASAARSSAAAHTSARTSTAAASSSCTDDDLSECEIFDRVSPWQEGEIFRARGNTEDGKTRLKVLAVVDDYLVFAAPERHWDEFDAVEVDNLRQLGRSAMNDVVPLYDGTIADGRAVTSHDNGQIFVRVGSDFRTQAATALDPAATHIALQYSAGRFDGGKALIGLAHEMSHAWSAFNTDDIFRETGSTLQKTWGEEGLADLMASEVLRRRAGIGLTEDYRWTDGASGERRGFVATVSEMTGELEAGREDIAGFFRRLVVQMMDDGLSYEQALNEVAVGTAEGWFGRTNAGAKVRPGLADRMQDRLGADWTPETELLVWTLAQAADGRTDNRLFQNRTFAEAYRGWTPDATLEAGDGRVADISRRNGSAGYLTLTDPAGEGATYRVKASGTDSPTRWMLLRID